MDAKPAEVAATTDHSIRRPDIALAITRRWISDVRSKIV